MEFAMESFVEKNNKKLSRFCLEQYFSGHFVYVIQKRIK